MSFIIKSLVNERQDNLLMIPLVMVSVIMCNNYAQLIGYPLYNSKVPFTAHANGMSLI